MKLKYETKAFHKHLKLIFYLFSVFLYIPDVRYKKEIL